jgi:hypothetical protein
MVGGFSLTYRSGNALNFAEILVGEALSTLL